MLEETEAERREALELREQRAEIDRELGRLQLQRLTRLQEGASGEELAPLDAEIGEVERAQHDLSVELSARLEARHEAFHSQWGQLFKAGHQNSRWAQQVQDYACLYTSQATNLMYTTTNTTFRALTDLMPHDRACMDTRTSI